MIYSENEILQYIDENDVKFVKLTFCDLKGKLKNISILSSELAMTFERGARITAKKITGRIVSSGHDRGIKSFYDHLIVKIKRFG